MRYHFTSIRMTIILKSIQTENYKCWQGCEEIGTLVHRWWESKMVQLLWKTIWRFLKNLKTELLYDTEIPLLGIDPKELKIESQRDICIPTFTAALFTIAKIWKQPKYPLMAEWINKMWSIHAVEYDSALKKKKEILQYATTWMNLEGMMLSEKSPPTPKKYYMIPLI